MDAKTTEPTALKINYTNWRGETAERTVMPQSIYFGSTRWHPEPQWLLRALDMNRLEDRDFALAGISAAPQPAASDVPHDVVRAPDAWIEREGLEALRRDKTSKTQVASGLLKRPFGDKVPLYNTPVPSNWTEEALRAENALLRAAAEAVLAAETHNLHVGYDNAAGGGNFVYADAIRTDDEAFAKLRSALSR